jgi:hypothetical protein
MFQELIGNYLSSEDVTRAPGDNLDAEPQVFLPRKIKPNAEFMLTGAIFILPLQGIGSVIGGVINPQGRREPGDGYSNVRLDAQRPINQTICCAQRIGQDEDQMIRPCKLCFGLDACPDGFEDKLADQ